MDAAASRQRREALAEPDDSAGELAWLRAERRAGRLPRALLSLPQPLRPASLSWLAALPAIELVACLCACPASLGALLELHDSDPRWLIALVDAAEDEGAEAVITEAAAVAEARGWSLDALRAPGELRRLAEEAPAVMMPALLTLALGGGFSRRLLDLIAAARPRTGDPDGR